MAELQLVLGSMERSDEYQRVLLELKGSGKNVQGEMVDRILDGGELHRDAILQMSAAAKGKS